LAPGLRLGWIQGNGELFDLLRDSALLQSGGGLAPMTSALLGALLANGKFQDNLAMLRRTYATRAEALYQGLKNTFGGQIEMPKPQGGYFLWLSFNDDLDVSAVREQARKAGVNYLPGNLCSAKGQFSNSMRLCFAWYGEEELKAACERLGAVLG
ncbi:aminotransferase class I/II-fold pyridoxal phosphate-dependent enzyme, partial [Oceanospirillum sp. HFRX-1_2]